MRLPPPFAGAAGEHLAAALAALRETAGLVLLALLCLQTTSWLMPVEAHAAGCPGAASCPYAGVQLIGHRAEGVLRFPEAVAIGPQGDIYVADRDNKRLQEISPDGTPMVQWSISGSSPADSFGVLSGVAVDSQGTIIFADSLNDRVQEFVPTK